MISIKIAQEEDLEKILQLQYLAYQSEAKLFDDPDIPPLKQTIEDVTDEFDKGIILKATDENGNIVGSVRAYSENKSAYISKLMVHPENQGKGIGTKLLCAIEKEFSCNRYELFTSTKSIGNIKLYERLGYKIFKTEQITEELQFVYMEKYAEQPINFAEMTACGESCVGCKKKADGICKGCIEADGYVPEWAESGRCKVHTCTRNHGVQFCGLCEKFPCDNITKIVHWNPDIVKTQAMLRDKFKERQGE